MTAADAAGALVLAGVAAPLVLVLALGAAALVNRRLPELIVGRITMLSMIASTGFFIAALPTLLAESRVVVSSGRWFGMEQAFQIDLLVDPMSLIFSILTTAVSGVVAAFSHTYLHREPGYHRYFILITTLVTGMLLIVLAGTVEVLFVGWELLGISSSLLIGFFHERASPVRTAMRVFTIYRVGDAAMLVAALLVHHYLGTRSMEALVGGGSSSGAELTLAQATVVGMLLVVAAAVKCAQLPFSGWLPRAMEGPTPSTAVFYGALSVHAGAYLLLRASPVLERSPICCAVLAILGLATSLYATLVGRVQTDIKTALSFASLTQVGIILVEIAIGLRWIPLIHMVGHSCIRMLQFLRAPSMLHDLHEVKNAVGSHIAHSDMHLDRLVPDRSRWWLYRFASERGYLDALLDATFVRPFWRIMSAFDRWEQRWCDRVSGDRGE